MQLINAYLAVEKAICEVSGKAIHVDYLILAILDAAQRPLSYNSIYTTTLAPGPNYNNSRYYNAIDRLVNRGCIVECTLKTARGRYWAITSVGRRALRRVEELASTYLEPATMLHK